MRSFPPPSARRGLLALGAAVLSGCGAAPAPPPSPVAPAATTEPSAEPVASASAAPEASATPAPSAAPVASPPAPEAIFPPAAFPPPFPRTAAPRDGVWTPIAGTGADVLYRSVVHPDAVKTMLNVVLVAVDLARVDVRLVAGTLEPLSTTVPDTHRPGVVPGAEWPGLLAVFNGGFMVRHGGWGTMVDGEVFLPPHDDGCTVALYRDGSVRVRTFAALAPPTADMLAYRQTPPCLVEQGAVQPALLGLDKPRRWGLSETGGVSIRRSSLGISADGRTLYYGLGEGITPRSLADAMHAAGAVDAAQLDVNWSYTRFFFYGAPAAAGAAPEIVDTLIPRLKHAAGQYVKKPSERDFFYLARKAQPSKSSTR